MNVAASRVIPDHAAWDGLNRHLNLVRLTWDRSSFRTRRAIDRMRSPRRIVATLLSIGFFAMHALVGVMILSSRSPADPDRLRLWLSGGMVLYAIYHTTKCVWTTTQSDLQLTAAESLWLGGGPLRRSSLAVYQLGDLVVASLMKSVLLAVVLYVDVPHVSLLLIAVFVSLLMLETTRLMVGRVVSAFDHGHARRLRIGVSLIAASGVAFVVARLAERTPNGSAEIVYVVNGFRSVGDLASLPIVQWLSFPWICASRLAVAEDFGASTGLLSAGTLSMLPLTVLTLVCVDRWTVGRSHAKEKEKLASLRQNTESNSTFATGPITDSAPSRFHQWQERIPTCLTRSRFIRQWIATTGRQAISIRRYRGEIAVTLSLPTLLCLSPLASGGERQPWFFVIGGVAMCTLLLAPPALRLDFRRDLKRMSLLRSLPVSPAAMVLGQLTLPILITWLFQATVLLTAASVLRTGWYQAILWSGSLAALAVFTFAMENGLFLIYPHHEKAQGLAMMIRTKLTFLGKVTVLAIAVAVMCAWGVATKSALSGAWQQMAFLLGTLAAAWGMAFAALGLTTRAWRRYDISVDAPPE